MPSSKRPFPVLVQRRTAVVHGLAGFASLMMVRSLGGCGDDSETSDGKTGSGTGGAGGGSSSSTATGGGGGDTDFPVRALPEWPPLVSLIADIGPLGEPDDNGVRVPEGFTARIIGQSGTKPHAGSDYEWHLAPDGGATYPTEDGGWIYCCNSEVPIIGGAGAIRFDPEGEIAGAYSVLQDTDINCAGGPTPWHTWLSCEEASRGGVYECDPWGELPAVARPALGVFKHEAVTIDPDRGQLYLTEDLPDGRLYRFTPDGETPNGALDLTSGKLDVAIVSSEGDVSWAEVPDPLFEGGTPTREQVAESTAFDGGEGVWYHRGVVYFSTKGTSQVWALDVESAKLSVLYDRDTADDPVLGGVDNITVSASGDVLVAEDRDDMQIVAILPDGSLKPLVQIVGHDTSEITGPAFDPSGTRLYFSSQRGPNGGGGAGVTYEVTGPFHQPA